MSERLTVYIGYDPAEDLAWQVCAASLLAHASIPLDVRPLLQAELRARGLYRRRETVASDGQRWCEESGAPCATEFSNTRHAVPLLAPDQWALFCDGDFLWRADVARLLDFADDGLAALCVQHEHVPREDQKMRGQVQTKYSRKNWSSLVLWNSRHEANRLLPAVLNAWPGRALHAFRWLEPGEIGALPGGWNWLEGVDPLPVADAGQAEGGGPAAVHYTLGTPDMLGREGAAFAPEWWSYVDAMGCGPSPDQRRA